MTIEKNLKNSLPFGTLWFERKELCAYSFHQIKNAQFIAFFDKYDDYRDLGVDTWGICTREEKGYFVLENKVVKKGREGMPGISVDYQVPPHYTHGLKPWRRNLAIHSYGSTTTALRQHLNYRRISSGRLPLCPS